MAPLFRLAVLYRWCVHGIGAWRDGRRSLNNNIYNNTYLIIRRIGTIICLFIYVLYIHLCLYKTRELMLTLTVPETGRLRLNLQTHRTTAATGRRSAAITSPKRSRCVHVVSERQIPLEFTERRQRREGTGQDHVIVLKTLTVSGGIVMECN